MKNLPLVLLLSLGLGLSSTLIQADVSIEQGYVRASPPGISNGAAFLTLHNSAITPVSLIAARTPAANSAELHNHVEQDGVLRMRQVPEIKIPAQGSISLQPGGYHVMLMGLKAPLKAGSEMPLMLEFSSGQSTEFSLPIRKTGPMKKMKMPQGGHSLPEKTLN
ncbi:MAG: copper(I)-binding protein [Motiliproteus sp.]|jgi:copper(I)-binding protein